MAKSTRAFLKDAGSAAAERTLESFLPSLLKRLDQLDERLAAADREMFGLRSHIDSKFDQTLSAMNELGQRVARVEGKIEAFMETLHTQSARMDQWIERLVRVEIGAPARSKKKAS